MSDQPAATALNPEFETVLRECLDDLIAWDVPLHEDTDLSMLIDSISVVRLLAALEDTFGVTVPDETVAFEIFSSPRALWTVVSGLMEESGER